MWVSLLGYLYFAQLRAVAQVGEHVKFEACMDVMDLLYENEETSVLYSSPEALAASVVVCSLFLQLQSVLYSLCIY